MRATGLGNPVEYQVSPGSAMCSGGHRRPTRGPGAVDYTQYIVLGIGIGCWDRTLTQSALSTENGLQTGHLENLHTGTEGLEFQRPGLSPLAEEELVTPCCF